MAFHFNKKDSKDSCPARSFAAFLVLLCPILHDSVPFKQSLLTISLPSTGCPEINLQNSVM